jgi:hypothetical protein
MTGEKPSDSPREVPALPKSGTLVAKTGVSTPVPAPLPQQPLDWADISKQPARWPAQTQLKKPVDFPLVAGSKTSGSVHAPKGTMVRVGNIAPDGVEIAYAQFRIKIPVGYTTLDEQLLVETPEGRGQGKAPAPGAESPIAPADSLKKTGATTEEKPAPPRPSSSGKPIPLTENTMVPQKNFLAHIDANHHSSIELLKVITPHTQGDPSLEVPQHPEIYNGVALMMPLKEALKVLGLEKEAVPAKSPVTHPGIPFFFRSFPNKISPVKGARFLPESEDYFNLLYIVTDALDRVVGIEFVCEAPSTMKSPNTNFLTYNYILNRTKAITRLKVRCEVNGVGDDLLIVQTWLIDEPRNRCLGIVRWYLPTRIGNFIHYVLQTRLGFSE